MPPSLNISLREPTLLELSAREDHRLHSQLVQGVRLTQVEDVELDLRSFILSEHDFEVVPLGVPLGIQIILQPEIVLDVVDFSSFSQIATFEAGVKDQQVVLLRNVHSILCLVVVSLD